MLGLPEGIEGAAEQKRAPSDAERTLRSILREASRMLSAQLTRSDGRRRLVTLARAGLPGGVLCVVFFPQSRRCLSQRQQRIVVMVGEGCSNKLIAAKLGISLPTVATHLSRIFGKLGISSRAELAPYAALFSVDAS